MNDPPSTIYKYLTVPCRFMLAGEFTPEEEEIAQRLTEELGQWGVEVQAPTFIASLAKGCIQNPHLDMPIDGGEHHFAPFPENPCKGGVPGCNIQVDHS